MRLKGVGRTRGALNTIFRGLDFALGVMKSAQSPFPKMDLRQKKRSKEKKEMNLGRALLWERSGVDNGHIGTTSQFGRTAQKWLSAFFSWEKVFSEECTF